MSNPNDRPSQFFPHESDPAWPFRHVGLFCDCRCGTEIDGDFCADDLDQAYAALRTHATAHGWTITDTEDVCPRCTLIEEMRVLVEDVRHILATFRQDGRPYEGTPDDPYGALAYARDADRSCVVVARSTFYRRGVRITVSTVYLGMDSALGAFGGGLPLIYETMIFHAGRGDRSLGSCDEHCWRYTTREAALHGHRQVSAAIRQARTRSSGSRQTSAAGCDDVGKGERFTCEIDLGMLPCATLG